MCTVVIVLAALPSAVCAERAAVRHYQFATSGATSTQLLTALEADREDEDENDKIATAASLRAASTAESASNVAPVETAAGEQKEATELANMREAQKKMSQKLLDKVRDEIARSGTSSDQAHSTRLLARQATLKHLYDVFVDHLSKAAQIRKGAVFFT